jgi:hypothetical protein
VTSKDRSIAIQELSTRHCTIHACVCPKLGSAEAQWQYCFSSASAKEHTRQMHITAQVESLMSDMIETETPQRVTNDLRHAQKDAG